MNSDAFETMDVDGFKVGRFLLEQKKTNIVINVLLKRAVTSAHERVSWGPLITWSNKLKLCLYGNMAKIKQHLTIEP